VRLLAVTVPALLMLALAALGGCGETYTEEVSFVRTSTVPLGQQTTLVVDAPLPLEVVGRRRSTDLVYHLDATMTASTASIAVRLAEAARVKTELEGLEARLEFEGFEPDGGRISGGRLRVWVPDDMDVQLVGRGGPVDVSAILGDVDVVGATHARVVGAEGSVRVAVDQGNAIAEVAARPGSIVELATNRGDVQVLLPAAPSVTVQARADNGAILVRHPNLPRYAGGGLPYGAVVNGGLSQVVLTSVAGNVVIDAR
jgi:hypothetical protein